MWFVIIYYKHSVSGGHFNVLRKLKMHKLVENQNEFYLIGLSRSVRLCTKNTAADAAGRDIESCFCSQWGHIPGV